MLVPQTGVCRRPLEAQSQMQAASTPPNNNKEQKMGAQQTTIPQTK